MTGRLRGIFPVIQTPLDASGELDEASLRGEIAFSIRAGAHGVVFPVLGSEFQYLSDRERQRLVEVVVGEAAHQLPVVVGVAGPSAAIAVEHAQHAARAGADAIIALPPYLSAGTQTEMFAYYQAIARAADLPLFVQHSQPGIDATFLSRLMAGIEQVRYVKEEMAPSAHNIGAMVQTLGERCWGVFGGALGRWMLSELRRGATGFMPAAECTDVFVQVWDAFQAGDEPAARRIFNQLLPLINFELLLGLQVCKEVLVRRGVLCTAAMRTPGSLELDADDRHELDTILADLSPLFLV